ncbi:hypothetical protein Hanom_Chr01g00057101 [Helianthus anomalus]
MHFTEYKCCMTETSTFAIFLYIFMLYILLFLRKVTIQKRFFFLLFFLCNIKSLKSNLPFQALLGLEAPHHKVLKPKRKQKKKKIK